MTTEETLVAIGVLLALAGTGALFVGAVASFRSRDDDGATISFGAKTFDVAGPNWLVSGAIVLGAGILMIWLFKGTGHDAPGASTPPAASTSLAPASASTTATPNSTSSSTMAGITVETSGAVTSTSSTPTTSTSSAPPTSLVESPTLSDVGRSSVTSASGEIQIGNDYDEWGFDGQSGDVVTVEAIGGDGLDRLHVLLFQDLTGNRIAGSLYGCDAGVARALNVELPASGTYTARVASCQDRTGSYQMAVWRKELTGALGYQDVVSGEIQIGNDYDEWGFDGQSGDVVTVEAIGGDGLDRLHVLLFQDLTGNRIAGSLYGCDAGVARALNVELPASGTYTARVASCQDRTGSYELAIFAN